MADKEIGPEIIFVTGASRSGTTMLSRILGNHEAVGWMREQHYFGEQFHPQGSPALSTEQARKAAAVIRSRFRDDLFRTQLNSEDFSFAASLLEQVAPQSLNGFSLFLHATKALVRERGETIPCEQTPRNILYTEQLLEQYPRAQFVHIVRDPRAVLSSQKSRWKLRANGNSRITWFESLRTRANYHPFTIAKLWNEANTRALSLKHHPRVHLVSYEALLQEPEATIAQLCDQMGLTYSEEMLNIPHWGSSHSDVDDNQRGITRKANNHWQHGLTAGEVASIEKRCREVMQAFGYEAHSQNAPFTWRQYLTFPIHLLAVLGVNPGRALTHLRALTGR